MESFKPVSAQSKCAGSPAHYDPLFRRKKSAADLGQTSELRGHKQTKNYKNLWDLSQRISSTPIPYFVEQFPAVSLQHAFPSKG